MIANKASMSIEVTEGGQAEMTNMAACNTVLFLRGPSSRSGAVRSPRSLLWRYLIGKLDVAEYGNEVQRIDRIFGFVL